MPYYALIVMVHFPVQVSRALNKLIQNSTQLQYELNLAIDALVDGSLCRMDVRARLQAVLDRREARYASPSHFVARPVISIAS